MLEPEFYVRNRTGELMSRATNDLNAVRMVLGPGIMYSATTMVTMLVAVFLMFKLSPLVDMWVLLPVPIVAVVVRHFGKVIHELYEKIQASLAAAVGKGTGKFFGRARDPSICAGRRTDSRIRRTEPRVRGA